MEEIKRHPLNANGDFYVEYDTCLQCDAPYSEAPELMDYDEDFHCYFKRQPETEEEIEQAINAVCVSCIEAVRYGGDNPEILEKIDKGYYRNENTQTKQSFEKDKSSERIIERFLKLFRK